MPSRKPILRRSPRLHPLRRSPRLAALANAAAAAAVRPKPNRAPTVSYVASQPVSHESQTSQSWHDINERPRKRQKTQYEPQPISPSSSNTDDMTEEEFNRFNDTLSDEDKELQASLLMWCISCSIPYTLDLFHDYKRNVEQVRAMGLF